jgi:starch synthase
MNILFVGAESVPFAKKGGLADVMGSLPPKLRELGIDARVLIPYYGSIEGSQYGIQWAFSFTFPRPTGTTDVHIFKATYEEVPFYFVRAWPFFGEESPNMVYSQWNWDMPRYIFFNQIAMAIAWEIRVREGWFPDVFNANDWHTGLLPFLLDTSRGDPNWGGVGSVLSIHNAGEDYQGQSAGGWLWQLQIPPRNHSALIYGGLTDNMLAIGTAYADVIVPVSPRYAVEIHYPYASGRLSGLIFARTDDVHGILNGIDVGYWNPETDNLIAANYNAKNFVKKRPANKKQLQTETGLSVREDIPIVGVVTRLVRQKGFDLAVDALFQLVVENKIQFVLVGSGDAILDIRFADLARAFPERVTVETGFNEPLAHQVYAGCDIFLMPSHYEPCGIGQMIAMRYGALPLVRETGGLADTVENYDNGAAEYGNGFVFQWEEPEAVLGTLRWAIDTYHNKREAWQRMQKRGMETDFSWDKSAKEYIELYQQIISRRRGG